MGAPAEQSVVVPLRWLTLEQAAEYVKLSPRTLERFRRESKGPRCHRIGEKKFVYELAALDAWVQEGGAQ